MRITKKVIIRSLLFAFATSVLWLPQAKGQNVSDITEFLKAQEQDASKLTEAYISPVIEGLSYGVNGGWVQTAKAHKTFGFDIGVTFTGVLIPTSKNYFIPDQLGLQTTRLKSTTGPTGNAPTIVGPADATTYDILDSPNGNPTGATFDGPEGLDFKGNLGVSGVPTPMVQAGIGIYKNTDLKIRWVPSTKIGNDTQVQLIGFGVMHDIKQHIKGIKLLPFDLSVLVAFTDFKGKTDVSGGSIPPAPGNTQPQIMDYELQAWLFEALISKKISVVTFYGGVGYNLVNAKSRMKGSYDVFSDQSLVLNDPVSIVTKNKGFRLTGGLRLKFGPFYLFGDYTLQEYSAYTAGLGFAVR